MASAIASAKSSNPFKSKARSQGIDYDVPLQLAVINRPVHTKRDLVLLHFLGLPEAHEMAETAWYQFGAICSGPSSLATNLADIDHAGHWNFPTANSGGDVIYECGLGADNYEEGVDGVVPGATTNVFLSMVKRGILPPDDGEFMAHRWINFDNLYYFGPTKWSSTKQHDQVYAAMTWWCDRANAAMVRTIQEARLGTCPFGDGWVECTSCRQWRYVFTASPKQMQEIAEEDWSCSMNPDPVDGDGTHKCEDAVMSEDEAKGRYDCNRSSVPIHSFTFGRSAEAHSKVLQLPATHLAHGQHLKETGGVSKGSMINDGHISYLHRQFYRCNGYNEEVLPELPILCTDAVVGSTHEECPVGYGASAKSQKRLEWRREGGKMGSKITNELFQEARLAIALNQATEKQTKMVLAQQAKNDAEKKRIDDAMGAKEEPDESKWHKIECSNGCESGGDGYVLAENTYVERGVFKDKVPSYNHTAVWVGSGKGDGYPMRATVTSSSTKGRKGKVEWFKNETEFYDKYSDRMTSATGTGALQTSVKRAAAKGESKVVELINPKETLSVKLANGDEEFNSPALVLGVCPVSECKHQMEVVGKDTEWHYRNTIKRRLACEKLRD